MTGDGEGAGQALFSFVRHWSRRWRGPDHSSRAERGRDVLAVETVHALEPRGGVTVNDVAAELGLDQSNASRLLAHASQEGYLAIEASADDRRRRAVVLTSRGRELLDAAHEWQEAVFATLTEDWTATERADFSRGMSRLISRSATLNDRP